LKRPQRGKWTSSQHSSSGLRPLVDCPSQSNWSLAAHWRLSINGSQIHNCMPWDPTKRPCMSCLLRTKSPKEMRTAEQETQSSKRQKIMGVIDQHHLNGGLTRTQRAVWCAHLLDEANGTSLESVLGAQEKWKLPPGLVGKSDRKSQSPSVKREEGEPTEDVPTHTTTETTGDVQVTFVNSMGIATQTISLCQVRLLRNFC